MAGRPHGPHRDHCSSRWHLKREVAGQHGIERVLAYNDRAENYKSTQPPEVPAWGSTSPLSGSAGLQLTGSSLKLVNM